MLPKTRHGSVHSTSSEGSIDSVIEELEQQKHYDQRRKSFEQLRKRFTDPESDSSSSDADKSDRKTRSDSEGNLNSRSRVTALRHIKGCALVHAQCAFKYLSLRIFGQRMRLLTSSELVLILVLLIVC